MGMMYLRRCSCGDAVAQAQETQELQECTFHPQTHEAPAQPSSPHSWPLLARPLRDVAACYRFLPAGGALRGAWSGGWRELGLGRILGLGFSTPELRGRTRSGHT